MENTEIRTTLTEGDMVEIVYATFSKKKTILVHAVAAFNVVMAVYTTLSRQLLFQILFVGMALVLEDVLYLRKRKLVKMNIERLHKLSTSGELKYRYIFGEKEVLSHNETTGLDATLPYSNFVRYEESAHFGIFLSKEGQYIAVEKTEATKANLKEKVLAHG